MRNKKKTETQPAKHPGDVLLNHFMKPLGLSANRLAGALQISSQRVGEVLNGRRGITAETAMRLSKLFGTHPKYWLDLQTDYELWQAGERWADIIDQEIRPLDFTKCESVAPTATTRNDGRNKQNCPQSDKKLSDKKLSDKKLSDMKLSSDEKMVYELISDDLTHFDVLCQRSGMNAGNLAANLTMLELSKLVKRHLGDYYSKADFSR